MGDKPLDLIKIISLADIKKDDVTIEGKMMSNGYLISKVGNESIFHDRLSPGDLIVKINGIYCADIDVEEFHCILAEAKRKNWSITFKAISKST